MTPPAPTLESDIAAYLSIQERLDTLCRRWVTAYEGTFQGYTVSCVRLSYAHGVGTISFTYRHCDGVVWQSGGLGSQIPATYLHDSSTLEADARAAKQALYAKNAAEQAERDAIVNDPAVRRYLDMEYRRQHQYGFPTIQPFVSLG